MAEPFDASLPTVGQKPWSLNPAVEEVRGRLGEVEDFVSGPGLTSAIQEAAENLPIAEVDDAIVADKIADPASATNASLVGQVEDSDTPVGSALADKIVTGAAGMWPRRVPPSWFSFSNLGVPAIYRRAAGDFLASLDTGALNLPGVGVTYYVSPTGVSGNSGTSPGSPTTLQSANAKPDVGTIGLVGDGQLWRNTSTLGVLNGKNLRIVGQTDFIGRPRVSITAYENPSTLTWTLHTGSVYKTTRASTQLIVDQRSAYLRPSGDYRMYTKVADAASVDAEGKWAIVGSDVYVWAMGNANLTTDSSFLRLSLNTGSGGIRNTGNSTIYLENVGFEGCGDATFGGFGSLSNAGTGDVPRMFARNCYSRYNVANGITMIGGKWGIFIECETSSNGADGFNYHSGTMGGNTYIPDIVEVRCGGYDCGIGASIENNNVSTAHDGVPILRVGKHPKAYRHSLGPVIADDSGAKSWNLGIAFGQSDAVVRSYSAASTAAGSRQAFDECTDLGGSLLTFYADGTSRIDEYLTIRTGVLGYSSSTAGAATVTGYAPETAVA